MLSERRRTGQSNWDALATNAQRVIDSIAPGLVADLVVLEGDPLLNIEDVRRIRGVMLGGRWLSRTALDAVLAGVERAEAVRTMDWIRWLRNLTRVRS